MTRREFEDPVEQVMFILGFKHDPRYETALRAMMDGANPGILNAIDQLSVHAEIASSFQGWRQMMAELREQFGSDL